MKGLFTGGADFVDSVATECHQNCFSCIKGNYGCQKALRGLFI